MTPAVPALDQALTTDQVRATLQLSGSAFYRRLPELLAKGLIRVPGTGHPRYSAASLDRVIRTGGARAWRRAS